MRSLLDGSAGGSPEIGVESVMTLAALPLAA
jgi:hypothetical protein